MGEHAQCVRAGSGLARTRKRSARRDGRKEVVSPGYLPLGVFPPGVWTVHSSV